MTDMNTGARPTFDFRGLLADLTRTSGWRAAGPGDGTGSSFHDADHVYQTETPAGTAFIRLEEETLYIDVWAGEEQTAEFALSVQPGDLDERVAPYVTFARQYFGGNRSDRPRDADPTTGSSHPASEDTTSEETAPLAAASGTEENGRPGPDATATSTYYCLTDRRIEASSPEEAARTFQKRVETRETGMIIDVFDEDPLETMAAKDHRVGQFDASGEGIEHLYP
jgi:hypothetical protein